MTNRGSKLKKSAAIRTGGTVRLAFLDVNGDILDKLVAALIIYAKSQLKSQSVESMGD